MGVLNMEWKGNKSLSSCGWVAGLSINTVRRHVALPLTSTTLLFIFPGFLFLESDCSNPAGSNHSRQRMNTKTAGREIHEHRRGEEGGKSHTWWWPVWWGRRGTWRAPNPPRCGTQSCGQKRTGCGLARTGSSLRSHCGLFGCLTGERDNTTHLRPSKIYAPAEGFMMCLGEKTNQNKTTKYEQIPNNKWGID